MPVRVFPNNCYQWIKNGLPIAIGTNFGNACRRIPQAIITAMNKWTVIYCNNEKLKRESE